MKDTIYRYNTQLRIALLADLHDREFSWIIGSLKAHKPDLICIAGDVVHRVDTSMDELVIHQTKYVLPFLNACADIAPTFMSLCNHEWTLCDEDIAMMAETGVTILDNSFVQYKDLVIGGLSSAGVTAYKEYRKDKPERYPDWDYGDSPNVTEPDVAWLNEMCRQDGYKILLCHHPEYRDTETNEPFGDDEYILFINGAYNNEKDDSDLAKLIHDFGCTKPSDMYFSEMSESAHKYKETEEGVSEMCKMMEDMRNNAEKAGVIKTLVDLVKKGLLTLAQVAEQANMTVDEFEKVSGLKA